MNFRILPSALADLREIDNWVAEQHGQATALNVQQDLLGTIQLLAEFPPMGHARPEVTSRPVRFFSHWPCWIIYSVEHAVCIQRIVHGSRDLPRLLRKALQ